MTDPRKRGRFQLRWTEDEELAVRRAAEAVGLSVSEYVRVAVRRAVEITQPPERELGTEL